jgi:cold shock CspA family protein
MDLLFPVGMGSYLGRISYCYYERKFGFIKPYGLYSLGRELFFYFSNYEGERVPEKGKIVQFSLSRNDEGLIAVDIKEKEIRKRTLEIIAS